MAWTLLLLNLVLAATLMRALLVSVKAVSPVCARCGHSVERRHLGEQICSCRG